MISLLLSEKKEDTIIGNKDLAGKQLLQWPDVFADISNVNLFQGEPVLTEECMTPEPAESVSKLDGGKLKEMRSDIHMKYHHGKDTVFFRIENQSDICLTMPLRDMGYQYAGYEKQLQHLKDQNCQKGVTPMRYAHELVDGQKLKPIVTMVLNYSQEKWESSITLADMLELPTEMKEELMPWIAGYSIYVVNLAQQDEETICKYQSDFRLVVEFLTNPKNLLLQKWSKENRKVRHPVELADMLYALSKDERYQLICEELSEKDMKGEVRMCELLDIVENRGLQQGQEKLNALIRKLMAEGRYEELARSAADSEYQKELMRECHIIT